MHKIVICGVLACSVGLTGCATNAGSGAGLGCLMGGLIGAVVIKDAKAGAALGCAAGGVIGFAWGNYLDDKERKQLAEASARAAAEGRMDERVAWGGAESTPRTSTHAPSTKVAAKNKSHVPRKSPPAQSNPANSSTESTGTPSATLTTDAATGWVVPVSETYVENGKTLRKLHQVAIKNGKTYEHDVVAQKTASGWVVPDNA